MGNPEKLVLSDEVVKALLPGLPATVACDCGAVNPVPVYITYQTDGEGTCGELRTSKSGFGLALPLADMLALGAQRRRRCGPWQRAAHLASGK